jgi:hypothetical protein
VPDARIKQEKQMGKMKTLGEDLKEKLDWIYEEESRKLQKQILSGVIQGGAYAGQGLRPKNRHSSMMKVDDPNKREAYVIPLSTLVNLWRAKFGDLWIDVSEIDDEFWSDASARLHINKLMEEIEFRESNTPWARLKEDA